MKKLVQTVKQWNQKPKTFLICLSILLGSTLIALVFLSTEPTSKPTGASKTTAMLVDTLKAKRGNYRPEIEALGTVKPAVEITLNPRISGQIMKTTDKFVPGGFVAKGDLLLRIDPSDYQNAVKQKRSELRRAKSELSIELGRQDVAEKEINLLEEKLTQKNKKLILRKPQLNSARAEVESAQAAFEQAKLNLERTKIQAPFDAQILDRKANVGSQVAPGDKLARLVGTDRYWIIATVPLSKSRWIQTKESGEDQKQEPEKEKRKEGSSVRIRNRTAWPEGVTRQGYVSQIIGSLDEDTRMARVVVTANDPLARQKEAGGPPLMIGSLLHVVIKGKKISDVIRIPRDYIREQDKAWVMVDGQLEIRDLDIVLRDATYAYVREGIKDGEAIVTTNLATVTEGAPLRTEANQE